MYENIEFKIKIMFEWKDNYRHEKTYQAMLVDSFCGNCGHYFSKEGDWQVLNTIVCLFHNLMLDLEYLGVDCRSQYNFDFDCISNVFFIFKFVDSSVCSNASGG